MIRTIAIFSFLFIISSLNSQTVIGVWKNIDDEDGKEKSHIEIYEKNGKVYGKVIKLLSGASLTHCTACKGDLKGKPIVGMNILWDMNKKGNEYVNGNILDPKKGKVYDCDIHLDGPDKLIVRGYVGFSAFGRSQTWYRVK